MKIRFLVAGEKGIFERMKALADNARQETPLTIKLFQERLADPSVFESMKALEKQSNELTFKLGEDIMSGAINPAVLRDLLHVTDQMGRVFDGYYFIAREVNRTVKSGVELPMPDKMRETFIAQVNIADKQLEALGKLLEANSMDEVRSWMNEIGKLEEAGDVIKDSCFDDMYTNRTLYDFFSFQHYITVLKELDNIQDSLEETAALLRAIAHTLSR
jgi:uncharacterized protein Yka (UPF0111/DUF47 family)